MELIPLAVLAFFAGFIDAVVGGGGLIQVPSLFTFYPQATPAVLFGTNKFSSIFGTSAATLRYRRGIRLPWSMLLPAMASALVFSFLGAGAVSYFPKEVIRPLVLILLIVVAVYTFVKKDFGKHHAPRLTKSKEKWFGFGTGAALGFYDGFFGPGAGTFLIFIFVRVFGFSFLSASASAKVVNTATNFAALLYFLPTGNILWAAGLVMAACNLSGSFIGSHIAITRGAPFIRRLFLAVTTVIIAKFAYDTVKLLNP